MKNLGKTLSALNKLLGQKSEFIGGYMSYDQLQSWLDDNSITEWTITRSCDKNSL